MHTLLTAERFREHMHVDKFDAGDALDIGSDRRTRRFSPTAGEFGRFAWSFNGRIGTLLRVHATADFAPF